MPHQRLIRLERVETMVCPRCHKRTEHAVYSNRMTCTMCKKTTFFGHPNKAMPFDDPVGDGRAG